MPDVSGRAEYHYVLVDFVCKVVSGELVRGRRRPPRRMGAPCKAERIPAHRWHPGSDREGISCTPKTYLNSRRCARWWAATCAARWGAPSWPRWRRASDRAAIAAMLADTAEAIEYLRTASQPQPASRGAAIRVRFDDAADPGPALARLRIEGATLDATEIFELARLLDMAAETRSILLSAREKFPRLAAHALGHRRFARVGQRSARENSSRRNRGRSCQRRARAPAPRSGDASAT